MKTYVQLPRWGYTVPHMATWETSGPGRQEAEGAGSNWMQEPLLWFLQEGMGKAGLELASSSHFSRLWRVGHVSRCLEPGPGMIRAGVECPGTWAQERRWSSGWAGPHRKETRAGEPFANSRNWLNPGTGRGSPSRVSNASKYQSIRNTEHKEGTSNTSGHYKATD